MDRVQDHIDLSHLANEEQKQIVAKVVNKHEYVFTAHDTDFHIVINRILTFEVDDETPFYQRAINLSSEVQGILDKYILEDNLTLRIKIGS